MDNYCRRYSCKQSQIVKGYKTSGIQSIERPKKTDKPFKNYQGFKCFRRNEYHEQSCRNEGERPSSISIFNTQGDEENNLDDQIQRHLDYLKSRLSSNPLSNYLKDGVNLRTFYGSKKLAAAQKTVNKIRYKISRKGKDKQSKKTSRFSRKNSIKKILEIRNYSKVKPKKIVIRSEIRTPPLQESGNEGQRNSVDNAAWNTSQQNYFPFTSFRKSEGEVQYQPLAVNNHCINLECVDVFPKGKLNTPAKQTKESFSSLKKIGLMNSRRTARANGLISKRYSLRSRFQ
ncbi:unnamed protein product [Moneuplotes crassus]|uniref:Uncharacterized protein n=1 Tax=Euplotes crassus TaxID=5936 RepID=A0AAD1UG89_EUPCR|nr:unnamed protein product [Moneuplotes crassus]